GATAEHGERHQPETHVIPLALEAAAGARESFSIYGEDYETPDGTCQRDFVHVLDIAAAHVVALDKMRDPGMHAYNIGTGISYSVRQVVNEVERITGRKVNARVAERRPGDPAVLCASPRRIMQELEWKPEHSSLEQILRSAWEWKQKQLRMSVKASSV